MLLLFGEPGALRPQTIAPPDAKLRRLAVRVTRAAATAAAAMALIKLGDYLMGWGLGVDGLFFARASAAPVLMSPATATALALLGAAIVTASFRRPHVSPLALAFVPILIGWLGISRYIFGGEPLLANAALTLPTALCIFALGCSALAARPDVGLVGLLLSDTIGGAIARRLLPAVVLVPLIGGWLRLQAQRAGWFGAEASVSLFALGTMLVFGALVWASAKLLDRTDRERRNKAEEVADTQRLLQNIVDNSGAVIYVKDLEGRYALVNRLYLSIFHLEQAAVIGKTDHDLFARDAADAFRAMDLRVTAAGHALIEEETAPLHDGPHTYVSVKCPLRDGADRITGVFGISTDITERKLTESRLAAQLGRLRLLDEITGAIGERQDLKSIYQVAVRSLETRLPVDFCCVCRYEPVERALVVICVGTGSHSLALELALNEHAGITIDRDGLSRCVGGELIHEPDLRAVDFPFPQRLAGGGLGAMVCAPLQSESRVFGVLVAARRTPFSFTSVDCEFVRQLSAHVALAARQAELHAALQHAYDELRESQQLVMQQERLRALGQMASGIAHDINNAISPVALYVESLLEHEQHLSERGRGQLATILRAIDDVAATVARMREFYRQREPKLTLMPVELNPLVLEVADLTRARWSDMPQQRGVVIRMHTELAPDLPAVLGVDSELREALTNLVFNAVDAMPDGGVLTLRTRPGQPRAFGDHSTRVLLEVEDTGVGMDETTRQRCLEPFFTTKGEQGTGLGLAMVYGAAERHGADIEIDSSVGRGTSVRLILQAIEPGALVASHATPPSAPMRTLRLLLIDDDPVLLHSLSETLGLDGHEVTVASGGEAGIVAFSAARETGRPFDAVLTDLGMPYVDGRKVASEVKVRSPATPVIMLTGWGGSFAATAETPPYVDRVLSKPPKSRELRAVLAQVTQPPLPAPRSEPAVDDA